MDFFKYLNVNFKNINIISPKSGLINIVHFKMEWMALSIITLGQHKRDDIYGIIPSTGEFCELFMDNGDDNN